MTEAISAKSNKSKPEPSLASTPSSGQLSVKAVAQFLNDLGKSLQRPANGPLLGDALVRLSTTLRKHQDKEFDEVLELLGGMTARKRRQHSRKLKPLEGVDLQALDTNQVKELLFDEHLSKQDLIEVGTVRLGFSRSRLVRQNKQGVVESVTTALLNEEAFDIISKEAEKEGIRRAGVKKLL